MTPFIWQNHRVVKLLGLSIRSVSTLEQTILNSDVMMLWRRSCWFSSGLSEQTLMRKRTFVVVDRTHWPLGEVWYYGEETLLQPRLTMTSQISWAKIIFVPGWPSGWIHWIQLWGSISPVHGVRLSSGKKQCVFKEKDYKMHESPNWANLTFKWGDIVEFFRISSNM